MHSFPTPKVLSQHNFSVAKSSMLVGSSQPRAHTPPTTTKVRAWQSQAGGVTDGAEVTAGQRVGIEQGQPPSPPLLPDLLPLLPDLLPPSPLLPDLFPLLPDLPGQAQFPPPDLPDLLPPFPLLPDLLPLFPDLALGLVLGSQGS